MHPPETQGLWRDGWIPAVHVGGSERQLCAHFGQSRPSRRLSKADAGAAQAISATVGWQADVSCIGSTAVACQVEEGGA